jgi:hypothetical protein
MLPPVSNYSSCATQHQRLLAEYGALIRFKQAVHGELAMYAMASTVRLRIESIHKTKIPPTSEVLIQANELAISAGIDDADSLKAIQKYLRSVAASARRLAKPLRGRRVRNNKKSPSETVIDEAIQRRRAVIENELEQIAPSIEKAWAALAHEVLCGDTENGPPDALCAFGVEEARKRFKANIARRRQDLLSGNAMAESARQYEQYWYASYLRYYEAFEPKDARELLLNQAGDIEDEMRSSAAMVTDGGDQGVYALPQFLDLMFAYGQCRTVRNGLFRIARRAIPTVLKWQNPGGAWSDWQHPARATNGSIPLVDDPASTASAVMLLARYGSAEERDSAFVRSQKWLVKAQNENGSWSAQPVRGAGLPISTTVRVLEALRLTGIPVDHPAVSRGELFLINQQRPPGLWWEKSGRWQTHLTAQVLEYFQSRTERPAALNSYFRSARALLLKSEQLTLSEDNADGPLATVAAYHGLEHFLYGCLLEMDPNELIYADAKGTTIGFNAALGSLERTLKDRGELAPNARLPYRQQLQHLGAKRDMFIHRAESISIVEAFGFVATCRAFVQRYDLPVLGFRLCE